MASGGQAAFRVTSTASCPGLVVERQRQKEIDILVVDGRDTAMSSGSSETHPKRSSLKGLPSRWEYPCRASQLDLRGPKSKGSMS